LARRILLADDSVTAQNMGRRILTDAGYEVVTVNNGSAALKKIAENKPDIIVLDVYMPGYGGLEVCQRVKEAAETARIPVLLTVGKLEPFRPEEARRVRADAFIIKPFEATELLTALTKLEDKIVAGPLPQKSGRFAKALAAVEGADFGDKETGWKNRLSIPGPNAKPAPAETDAPEAMAGPVRDRRPSEPEPSEPAKFAEPTPEFERPIPAGLPADITPEEIAAITAAAASFDGKAGHPTVIAEGSASESAAVMQAASAETVPVQPSESEVPAATLASAAELEPASPAETSVQTAPAADEVVSEAVAGNEAAREENSPAATESPAPVVEAISAPPSTAEEPASSVAKPSAGDAEVMAAIASLAPSNGSGSDSVVPTSASEIHQEVAVAVNSVVAAEAGITGPRWIAESVAVAVEESAATLEQEMEQAAAAKIAAEAARNDLAAAAVGDVPTPVPVVASTEPVSAEVSSVADAVSAPESVVSPIAEFSAAPESSAIVQSEEPAAAKKEESAYAAAASASSTSEHASPVEAISHATVSPEISESAAVASVEVVPQREAELAAAWQNWKQIRESFVSTPLAPVAETPAAEASSPQAEAPAPAKAEEAEVEAEVEKETAEVETSAGDPPGESKAIASIVDTMLAELRPKLVEEIAKKMNSEKKEKEKEKEKEKKKKR
jgi:twitching motility two-component system response regulator PilH